VAGPEASSPGDPRHEQIRASKRTRGIGRRGLLHPVELSLHRGEVVGVGGLLRSALRPSAARVSALRAPRAA